MKKFTKLFALLLTAVILAGALGGCALVGKDQAKYRTTVVATVGGEEITFAEVWDTFISNYYNYYYYLSQGSISIDSLFVISMNTLYNSKIKLDYYKTSANAETFTHEYVDDYANAKYLTKDEMERVLASAKYNLFNTLDTYLEEFIAVEKMELGAEESEDTSRKFVEYDEWATGVTYAEQLFNQSVENKDAEEYFEKFYSYSGFNKIDLDVNSYVLSSANATARLESLNERLSKHAEEHDEEVEPITASELEKWQNRAVKKYARTIKSSYGQTIAELLKSQVNQYVNSLVCTKYDLKFASKIEEDQTALKTALEEKFASEKAKVDAKYNVNPDSFVTDIEGLKDTSFIYSVPEKYQGAYIFVKNLLIPFTDAQTALLSKVEKSTGGTTSAEYLELRNSLVKDIVATNFETDEEVEGLFDYVSGKVVLQGELATALPENGTVTPDEFQALMSKFNSDTAQHGSIYEYVIRVADKNNYTSNWVTEFDKAGEEVYALGQYHYSICVSKYGVHIVYYSSDVQAMTFEFGNIANTKSDDYRFFRDVYYSKTASAESSAQMRLRNDEYRYGEEKKIVATSEFAKMIELFNNQFGISYDFDAAMTKAN